MIKSKKEKPKPEGWEEIEPTLSALDAKMREAETVSHEGKRKNETLWPIYQIHYQRSRYIYEMYKEHKISRELYDYCVTQKIVDAPLIAKWKKPGYEKLCCLQCMRTKEHHMNTVCVCRIGKSKRGDKPIECVTCGCHGCCSGD